MNKKTKIILILRIILLICLIIFLFVFITTPKTNCQECSFKINNKTFSAQEFFQMYYDKCLVQNKFLEINFTLDISNETGRAR